MYNAWQSDFDSKNILETTILSRWAVGKLATVPPPNRGPPANLYVARYSHREQYKLYFTIKIFKVQMRDSSSKALSPY